MYLPFYFVQCSFLLCFVFFISLFLFFMLVSSSLNTPYLTYSLHCTVVEVVACLFVYPPPLTPFPMLLRSALFLQRSPPPLLQTFPPHPPTPPPSPACLSQSRGTRLLGASPRPWRQSYPSTQPPLCPVPGSGGPAYLHCSPPLYVLSLSQWW